MTDEGEGPIIVRRAVYTAAKQLEKANLTNDLDLTDWNLAQEKIDEAKKAGDDEQVKFWGEVYEYLSFIDFFAAGTPVEIID